MAHIDGITKGPSEFSFAVGKALKYCEHKPVLQFEPIAAEDPLPDISNVWELSKDQKYFYEICQAVSSGICPRHLENPNLGPLFHSRWVTRGNRILRLYMSAKNPSPELCILANYVRQVYASVWFNMKTGWTCNNEPRTFFRLVKLSPNLKRKEKQIVEDVLSRSTYFADPEYILIAMADAVIRQLAYRRILAASNQQQNCEPHNIRQLKKKKKASTYRTTPPSQIGMWEILEPPLIKAMHDDDLHLFMS